MSCRSLCLAVVLLAGTALPAEEVSPPDGFRALFNGEDLSGWRGMNFDPFKLDELSEEEREEKYAEWNRTIEEHWKVEEGVIVNDGHGAFLTTIEEFSDFELLLEYRTVPLADSGIYLKATPQVQIWDWTNEKTFGLGSNLGSGGLWNNSPGKRGKDPLVLADHPFGEWNSFRILQVGARTSVWLNDKLVVDHAIQENYWDRTRTSPLRRSGPIQLQTHGGQIDWRNIFIREIPAEEANQILREKSRGEFTSLFNGTDFTGWQGATDGYEVINGTITCKAKYGGNLYTEKEYGDFQVQLEFRLPAAGNNGLAIRYPGEGDPAYLGLCEIQILDDGHENYTRVDPRQRCGSIYGKVAAHPGYLRPTGEWNFIDVTVKGFQVTVELNGSVITNADVSKVTEFLGTRPHEGMGRTSGFFGLAGHHDPVEFRNLRIRELPASPPAQ